MGLCVTLWRLPTTIETFAASMGAGDSPTQSLFAALNSAAGGSSATQSAKAEAKKDPTLIAAGGRELSDEERERMLKRARAMAPLPLDKKAKLKPGEKSPEPNQQEALNALHEQLEEAMKLKNPG